MKKVNFKNALSVLVVTLCFVFFGAGQVSAQSVSSGVGGTASGDFVASTDARDILMDKVFELKDDMGQNPIGAVYTALERQYYYYMGMHTLLESSQVTVSEAIVQGLNYLNDVNGYGNLNKAQRSALMQLAMDDLSL